MNNVLIEELNRLGLLDNEQLLLKHGDTLECLDVVRKRLRRRQMWGTIALTVMMVFPLLMMCVSLLLRPAGSADQATLHPVYFIMLAASTANLMLLVECVRQLSRCDTLALLAKRERGNPSEASMIASA